MTFRPARLEEVIERVRDTAPSPLVFRGGGTKSDWGRPVKGPGYLLESRNLNGIVEHDPGDMTATILAGTPLVELQMNLAAHGQWLAIDPPEGPGRSATVGGIFAAHDVGPSRLAYGSLRELTIGMTVVLADGTVARSGGKVIKNVAGYDLCKLFCGSLGTLGFVYSLTVRVHPLPETQATVEFIGSMTNQIEMVLELVGGGFEPAAVDLLEDRLLVRFDGSRVRVGRQIEKVLMESSSRGLDGRCLEPSEAEDAWCRVSRALSGEPEETVIRVMAPSARLSDVQKAGREAAEMGGLAVRSHAHAALGLHTFCMGGPDFDAHVTALAALRERIAGFGRAVVRHRPEKFADLDVFGPPPAAAFLMQRVRDALDPEHRCAPGRLEWRHA